ncbi:hypothetical protein B296_00043246 [Ensete ventricosum]|uniref:Transposase (putative) gypsy type domain-containing protein n=1 Tax=Ensete ventricosum TaxID=4639 RepID=A0A426XL68_ENSVE|nr:hypothetical protein B296_00043246 [Ensete ventricosum]
MIRERYSIPTEYGLHVPQPEQRPYSLDAPGMCISMDALEVGLRFPLHPLIEEYLRWWRISPSQVAANSWRYLVIFLGECRGAGIIPTRDLFMTCFRLCKSQGGYYLTAQVDFRVSRAPSNNKCWKPRYLYVSGPVWGLGSTSRHSRSVTPPPYLSEEEIVLVGRLKGILSSSRAIKEMVELWLVEAGLRPASRGTIILLYFSLSNCSLTCWSECRSDGPWGAPRDAQGGKRQSPFDPPHRPGGKASSKRPIVTPTEQAEDATRRHKKVKVPTKRHKSRLGERESRSRSKGKEPATLSEEPEGPAGSEEGASVQVQ